MTCGSDIYLDTCSGEKKGTKVIIDKKFAKDVKFLKQIVTVNAVSWEMIKLLLRGRCIE